MWILGLEGLINSCNLLPENCCLDVKIKKIKNRTKNHSLLNPVFDCFLNYIEL